MGKKKTLLSGALVGAAFGLFSTSDAQAWDFSKAQPPTKPAEETKTAKLPEAVKVDRVNLIARLVDDPKTAHHEGSLKLIFDKDTDSYKVEVALDSKGQLCVDRGIGTRLDGKCFGPSELEVMVDDISGGIYNINVLPFNIDETGIPKSWIKDGRYSLKLWLKEKREEGGLTVVDQLASTTKWVKKKKSVPSISEEVAPIDREPNTYHIRVNGNETGDNMILTNPSSEGYSRTATFYKGKKYNISTDHPNERIGEITTDTPGVDISKLIVRHPAHPERVILDLSKAPEGIARLGIDVIIPTKDGKYRLEKEELFVNVVPEDLPTEDPFDLIATYDDGKKLRMVDLTEIDKTSHRARLEDLVELGREFTLEVDSKVGEEIKDDFRWACWADGSNHQELSRPEDLEVTPKYSQEGRLIRVKVKPKQKGNYELGLLVDDEGVEEIKLLKFSVTGKGTEEPIVTTVIQKNPSPEPTAKGGEQPILSTVGGSLFGSLSRHEFDLNAGGHSTFEGQTIGTRAFGTGRLGDTGLFVPAAVQFARTDFTTEGGEATQNDIELEAGVGYQGENNSAALTVAYSGRENIARVNTDGADINSEEVINGVRVRGQALFPRSLGDTFGAEIVTDIEAAGVRQRTGISFNDFPGSKTETRDLGTRLNIIGQVGLTADTPYGRVGAGVRAYSKDIEVTNGVEEGAASVRGLSGYGYFVTKEGQIIDDISGGLYGQLNLAGPYRRNEIGVRSVILGIIEAKIGLQFTETEIRPNKPNAQPRAVESVTKLNASLGGATNWEDDITNFLSGRTDITR